MKNVEAYRLQTELPALFRFNDDDHISTREVRLSPDLFPRSWPEESLPKWVKWSHQHGFLTRDQAHGSPGNWLDLYADADIPETEMFHTDRNKLISKFASSAAHVAGHQLTSAETGTWLGEHFTVTLGDLKGLADDMFLSGVNHIFYHGLCYSPDEAGWPGWHFYASTEMNPRNSIWCDAPALNEYIARCQSILQSGQPDNDTLLYWPIEDFWMQPGDKLLPQFTVHARDWLEGQPIGRTAKELWDRGYAFDYVSDEQLLKAKVGDDRKIRMPGGKYSWIIVPESKFMPLGTFQKLLSLAEEGAQVTFVKNLPSDISGANNRARQQSEFNRLKSKLSFQEVKNPAGVEKFSKLGQGSVECTDWLGFDEPMAKAGLSHIRRWCDGGWYYFIVNQRAANFDGWISLNQHEGGSAIIFDPMTGKSGLATRNKSGEIYLQLASGEAKILRVFKVKSNLEGKKVEGPAWNYWQTNGQPVEITGPWNVKFIEGGPSLPADFQTAKLASWTTFPDTNTQAFAGTAKYETTFDAPPSAGKTFELNLGDVRQSARVRVNGKDYGTLIMPQFRVVVDNLKPAGNTLEVEVTSVAANRIRDLDRRGVPWKTFRDINIVDINYRPFDAANWPLTDCGLLGPVTLTPVTAEK